MTNYIEIGSKLSCDWGAMHPTEVISITKIENGRLWTNSGFTMLVSDLRNFEEQYKSPIGVWVL